MGRELRSAIRRGGLTQREVAQRAGITEADVSRACAGRAVSKPKRDAIAEVLELSPHARPSVFVISTCEDCGSELHTARETKCDDCVHPLRGHRRRAGLSLAELGDLAGCSAAEISRIELGLVLPSVELGAAIARAVGQEPAAVFGESRSCKCGCGELTYSEFRESHRPIPNAGPILRRRFDADMQASGEIDAAELAARIGSCLPTIYGYARTGKVPARRDDWNGAWRFPPGAEAAARELHEANRHDGPAERLKQAHRDGRIPYAPRIRVEQQCACGCGRIVSRRPSEVGRGYYSSSCAMKAWFQTRIGRARRRALKNRWNLLKVRDPHKKGEAAARETLRTALNIAVAKPAVSRRELLDALILVEEGRDFVFVAGSHTRRTTGDPEYRRGRARVERRLDRAVKDIATPDELALLPR